MEFVRPDALTIARLTDAIDRLRTVHEVTQYAGLFGEITAEYIPVSPDETARRSTPSWDDSPPSTPASWPRSTQSARPDGDTVERSARLMMSDESDYVRADSVDHALELLADDPAAELLAGGHSFLPRLKRGHADPEAVIDIGGIDTLRGVTGLDDGDAVRIGALTTYATVEATDGLRPEAPALVEAVGATADTQIRNRATIGGNLVTPYPVSDLSAAAVAGDVTLVFEGVDGERRVDAETFLSGPHANVRATELLTRIEVPHASEAGGGAYVKRSSTTSRYTMLGVAVRLAVSDGTVSNAGVAVTGATDHAVRLPSVEEALGGTTLDGETISAAAARATADIDEPTMKDDSEATAAFRADMLPIETERALERAAARVDSPQ